MFVECNYNSSTADRFMLILTLESLGSIFRLVGKKPLDY